MANQNQNTSFGLQIGYSAQQQVQSNLRTRISPLSIKGDRANKNGIIKKTIRPNRIYLHTEGRDRNPTAMMLEKERGNLQVLTIINQMGAKIQITRPLMGTILK